MYTQWGRQGEALLHAVAANKESQFARLLSAGSDDDDDC